ncbi:hypothetical protein CDD83_11071 [Cordyceps sp. RAO-2017]|nr:hypothetical protein CDD83_11071 [Cordyceps sp. RAO-2017]
MAAERPEKKEKKEKKRSEEAGVSKSKKDKKEKKEKKEKLAAALEGQLQQDVATATQGSRGDDDDDDGSETEEVKKEETPLKRTVVPFAVPMADEKGTKKVYKTIRKAAKNGSLKRGVKEVVKALRKSAPSAPGHTSFPGVVVIAGDISPHDVISPIPVLCEDHNVPYVFVASRAELGASAKTKRPTSVVMLTEKREGGRKKAKEAADEDEADAEAYAEAYVALAKYLQKEYAKQAFWAKGESTA